MPGEMIKIVSMQGDSFSAYLARPVQPAGPGIVILNELFDINPWIKRIADEFSERGYLVCVPDLFWRSHNTKIAFSLPGLAFSARFFDPRLQNDSSARAS